MAVAEWEQFWRSFDGVTSCGETVKLDLVGWRSTADSTDMMCVEFDLNMVHFVCGSMSYDILLWWRRHVPTRR